MIVTRSWLQEWIDISEISSEELQKAFNSIGLEVDSYENFKIPPKVVIGYVLSKKRHENSDKLSICEVDVGSEVLQIVCGAKNVAAGQFVAVSLVGAVLPGGLKIKPVKLRGVESNGMICSSTELGLAKINDGIMVLDESIGELVLGKELKELLSDEIFDIDITPNRGDCLSVYGLARDLSAALGLPIKNTKYEEDENLVGIGRVISIHSSDQKDCSFQYRAFDTTGEIAPLDLVKKLRLGIAGIKSNSNIEDMLAYATHSTGVLLTAYDFNKICETCQKIAIEIKQEEGGNYGVYVGDTLLSMPGINQVESFKATDKSKTVLVEANYIDPKIISMVVGGDKSLKTPNSYRSTRGSEPNLNIGEDFLFSIIKPLKGFTLFAGYQQILPHIEKKIVALSVDELSKMIGKEIDKNLVVKILKSLGFETNVRGELINASVPFFRHDIENSHDICEEIVRIIGIDNIESKPLFFKEKNRINLTFNSYKHKKSIRVKAVDNGFCECIHYAFDNSSELKELGFKECKRKIINPLSAELDALRPTLLNHLLKSSIRNLKNSQRSVKLFEIGTIFDENGVEQTAIGFLATGLINEPSLLNSPKPKEIDFMSFASLIQNIMGEIECVLPQTNSSMLSEFEQADIVQNGVVIGKIGRLKLSIEAKMELEKTYLCEIYYDKLKFKEIMVKPYSKFPSISRDLSLIIPKSMRYIEIKKVIDDMGIEILKEFTPVDLYSDESLGEFSSLSIKFTFQSHTQTLEDSVVAKAIDEILTNLKDRLNIGIR
ncbi:MAG: phenylalanine--tRNA ligase subunit beta [Campylobacter sp.]|nr:phenylalanine--tRNA ligase subunit beta [Campylobacter sp.]